MSLSPPFHSSSILERDKLRPSENGETLRRKTRFRSERVETRLCWGEGVGQEICHFKGGADLGIEVGAL